jgi:alpha-mannosidase
MIGHGHLDIVWLWQASEGLQEVKATFRSALDRMREYPEFKFAASSAAYYEWIEENEPEMFEEIRRRVAEGRWEPVGGWWVEPDCNLPGGEAFVRQALLGQRYFQSRFGRTATVGFNPDSFGHAATLPQLLAKSGIGAYVFMRPGPHEKGLPGRLFWWEADDLSRVLAYRIPYEYGTPGGDVAAEIERAAAELRAPVDDLMCFYGVGNHGGGPTKANIEAIGRLARERDDLEMLFSTPSEFFGVVRSAELSLPTVHDELQHHASGCYAAHSGVKAWNRRAEQLLLEAEKFSTLAACVCGSAYPTGLTQAWKSVLFNQFHDVLAGTSIEPAYDDARHSYGEAIAVAGRALNHALQALAWRIDIPPADGSIPIVVFNPHAWPSRVNVELESDGLGGATAVEDEAGATSPLQTISSLATIGSWRRRVTFTAQLPPLGYRVYRTVSLPEIGAAPEAPPANTLESERWRLVFDPKSGFLTSLWDKREDCEVLLEPARAVVVDDPSDTWSHDVFRFQNEVGVFEAISVRLLEHGPVKSVLRIESRFGDSRLVQHYALFSGLDQIEVRVTVDWREQRRALKLRFPVNVRYHRATYEIPFGRIERPASGEEEPGQGWVDLSGVHRTTGRLYGLSLLNDCKYSYDVLGRVVSLTVLRSPAYAHHDPHQPADWTSMQFIDTSHRGTLPLARSFVEIGPDNVALTALKAAEDDSRDVVIRCYETAGIATRALVSMAPWQRSFEFDIGPFEIKTFRVPRDPARSHVETDLLERPLRGLERLPADGG